MLAPRRIRTPLAIGDEVAAFHVVAEEVFEDLRRTVVTFDEGKREAT